MLKAVKQTSPLHYEKYDQQVYIQNVNLLYYKQRSCLHVSDTYFAHLQGGSLRLYYIPHQNNSTYKYKMLSFK